MAVYNAFKASIMTGVVDLDTNEIFIALFDSTYTIDIDAHTIWSDISGSQVVGTGYTAGGTALTGGAVTVDTTDDEGVYDATDVTWEGSTLAGSSAVVYDKTSSVLIALMDFGAEYESSAGDFTIQFNAEGVLNLG